MYKNGSVFCLRSLLLLCFPLFARRFATLTRGKYNGPQINVPYIAGREQWQVLFRVSALLCLFPHCLTHLIAILNNLLNSYFPTTVHALHGCPHPTKRRKKRLQDMTDRGSICRGRLSSGPLSRVRSRVAARRWGRRYPPPLLPSVKQTSLCFLSLGLPRFLCSEPTLLLLSALCLLSRRWTVSPALPSSPRSSSSLLRLPPRCRRQHY